MIRAGSELHRVVRSELVSLAPPYRTAVPLHRTDGAALPLGSVVLARGDATLAALADLTALSHRAPWIVPSLALPTPQESLEPLLLVVTELRDRLVVLSEARPRDEVAHVVAAVRRRRAPTPATLARWVARRLATRELESPLRHQFEQSLNGAAADGGCSVASYSRLFSSYGCYTARDWRALARLCAHVVARTSADEDRREDDGKQLPFRTASHHAARYLGVPYRVTAERLGWEWVLEAALRMGRYEDLHPPVR